MQIKNFGWIDQVVWMKEAILLIAVAYIVLCKLNYAYHNQVWFHFFQMKHFSAVKFAMRLK